ncbi:MAG: S16 family serine protease [Candidatus Methanospirareceae archaeon]
MNWKDAIIVALCILLVLSTSSSFLIYQQQQQTIEQLNKIIVKQESIISGLRNEFWGASAANIGEEVAYANIVAVRSDTNEGVIGRVRVEIKEGHGRVMVDTRPFVEPDTQYSIREAVKVAEKFTKANLSDKDVIVSFEINGTLIGGPSAGAATTAATVAAIEGKKVREDVAITGTIEENGEIGRVGGVFEKALAAEKNGIKLFLVPKGQKEVVYYERKEEETRIGWFTITRVYYTPKVIDLGEYMKGKMDVKEVSTIDEVVAFMVY